MTARRPHLLLLLAAAGVLAGHLLGYGASAAVGVGTTTAHGHLDLLTDVLVPLGAILLVLIALAQPERSGWGRELTVPRLAGTQGLLYLTLEWGERAAQDQAVAELLAAPVVAGFVAQLLVAFLVVQGVRLLWRLLCPVPPAVDVGVGVVRVLGPGPHHAVRSRQLRGGPGARAPPRFVSS